MFAPAWNTVLKYVALFAMAAIAIGGMWYGVYLIHEDGRNVEKAVWIEKIAKDEKDRAKAQRKSDKAKKYEHDRQQTPILGALGNEKKKLAELEKRERAAIAANDGLWVTIKGFSTFSGEAGEAKSPGICSEASGRVRLSEQDEQNIREDYGLAQRVAIQYETCRETLIPLVEIVPDTELSN